MILWMIFVAFLSAFAVGPASFSIIRSLVSTKRWPWSSIAGFLLGDVIYIGLAIKFLQSPLFHNEWFKNILTGMTALFLLLYSMQVVVKRSEIKNLEIPAPGFVKSLLLTLSNFHLLLIYAGFFVHFTDPSPTALWLGVSIYVVIYVVTFVVSFIALLGGLLLFQTSLKTLLRKIEIMTACCFLSFSIYLFMEIL